MNNKEVVNIDIDFNKLNIKVPKNIIMMNIDSQKEIYEYLEHLDVKEKIAYQIAFEHLGSSFNILKSNGYVEWVQDKKN